MLRRTRTEVAVSGGTLPADAPVACLIGAAGRDPVRFGAPDRFDPLRADADPLLIGPAGCPRPSSADWRPNTGCAPC